MTCWVSDEVVHCSAVLVYTFSSNILTLLSGHYLDTACTRGYHGPLTNGPVHDTGIRSAGTVTNGAGVAASGRNCAVGAA